jgi:glutamyl-tRNA synthetase
VADLATGFDLADTSRSAARFDPADLDHLNARSVHTLGYERAAPRLEALGIPADPALWGAVAGNCATFGAVKEWWQVVTGPVTPAADPADADFLATARDLLPAEPFGGETFKVWTTRVKEATGRKGKALFMPLRLALTGLDHGPEMAALLPLIGRARVLERLG